MDTALLNAPVVFGSCRLQSPNQIATQAGIEVQKAKVVINHNAATTSFSEVVI